MRDFIRREDAAEAICQWCGLCPEGRSPDDCDDGPFRRLNALPAADVKPVVRGKWERVEVREVQEGILVASMFCPNCKRYHNEVYLYGPVDVNFCPFCGVRNGGGKHRG